MSRPFPRAVLLSLCGAFALAATLSGTPVVQAAAPTDLAGLHALEARALAALLKLAVKEDARCQAWYVATRLLAVDPKSDEAAAVLKKWKVADLELASNPSKGFKEKREATFRQVGDAYARLASDLRSKGSKPEESLPLVERALAYGTKDPDPAQTLDAAGKVWCGTYGTQAKADVQAAFGTRTEDVVWTPEYEDAYLRARVVWPDARVFGLREWRIMGAPTLAAAGKLATSVSAVEAHFVRNLGSVAKESKVKEDDPNWDLIVVSDIKTYDLLADPLFHSDDAKYTAWLATSSAMIWRKRVLVCEKDRDMDWIPAEARVSGWIARVLVRNHLAPDGYGHIGRGAWVLDGIRGIYEGFRAKGPEGGEIDFARCWKLAAARTLKDRGALVAWPKFLELDGTTAQDEAQEDLKFSFDGEEREAKKVSVVSAQATAFLIGIWMHDGDKGEKGVKKLSDLLIETYKRGRLPDVDKTCGWRAGTAVQAAIKALDLAPAK